jgi:hypothetical protein
MATNLAANVDSQTNVSLLLNWLTALQSNIRWMQRRVVRAWNSSRNAIKSNTRYVIGCSTEVEHRSEAHRYNRVD